MTLPVAPGAPLPPSPPLEPRERPSRPRWVSDQATPGNRVPVIDRSKVDPKDLEAAEGMESMFLDYMMQAMRKTVPKNDMDLENEASEIYRGMMDTEMADKAAKSGGVGLADTIIAYLQSQRYNLREAPEAGMHPDTRNVSGPDLKTDPRKELK